MMARFMMGLASLATVLAGCATGAPTTESRDRAECKQYASRVAEDPGLHDSARLRRLALLRGNLGTGVQ